jgi:subtilisin family serine protease
MASTSHKIIATAAVAVVALVAATAALATPNDPMLSTIDPSTGLPYEWQFAAANVGPALELSPGSPSIRVGVIDTGAANVPDLAGKVDDRWTVSQTGKLTHDRGGNDSAGHGTATSSLIAANVGDGFGMAGFGGATHLVVIRDWTLTDVSVAAALMKLDSLGVKIVNMSFGSVVASEPVLIRAVHKAAADGMLLIAATGNNEGEVWHPAADLQPAGGTESYGLAVGASDANGGVAFFSNRGDHLSLVAPGVFDNGCSGVLAAIPVAIDSFTGADPCYPHWAGAGGAEYAYVAGTSFAAPETAGIAALIWAARPELTNYQVADIIKQSARRSGVWNTDFGCGVLDAGAAVELALSKTAAEWVSTRAGDASCSATGQA